jgi:hypothetical protein
MRPRIPASRDDGSSQGYLGARSVGGFSRPPRGNFEFSSDLNCDGSPRGHLGARSEPGFRDNLELRAGRSPRDLGDRIEGDFSRRPRGNSGQTAQ